MGSCGVTPALKQAFAAKLEELYGITVTPGVGQDTYSSMVAAAERIRWPLCIFSLRDPGSGLNWLQLGIARLRGGGTSRRGHSHQRHAECSTIHHALRSVISYQLSVFSWQILDSRF